METKQLDEDNDMDDYFHGFHQAKQSMALTHEFFDRQHSEILESINGLKRSKRRNSKKMKEIHEKGWKRHQRLATLNKIDVSGSGSSSSSDDQSAVFDIADFAKHTYTNYNNNLRKRKQAKLDKKRKKKERKRKLKEKQRQIEQVERKMYGKKKEEHSCRFNYRPRYRVQSSQTEAAAFHFEHEETETEINIHDLVISEMAPSPTHIPCVPSVALSLMDTTREYNDPTFWNIEEKEKEKEKEKKSGQIFLQDINDIFNPAYNSKWIHQLNSESESLMKHHISLVPKLVFLSQSFLESKEAVFIFALVKEGIETLVTEKAVQSRMMKQIHSAFERDYSSYSPPSQMLSALQVLERQIVWIGNVSDRLQNNPFLSVKAFNNDSDKQEQYVSEFTAQLNSELQQLYRCHAQLAKQEQISATIKLKKLKKSSKKLKKKLKKKPRLFGWFMDTEINDNADTYEEIEIRQYTYKNNVAIESIELDYYSLYFILLCLLLRHYNHGRNFLSFSISRTCIRMTELGDKILDIFGTITKCDHVYRTLCYLKICLKVLSTEAAFFDDILQRLSRIQEYFSDTDTSLMMTLRAKLHFSKVLNSVTNWCKLCITRYQHVFCGATGPRALKSCLRLWKFCLLMSTKTKFSQRKWCEEVKQMIKKSIYDYEFPRLVELYKPQLQIANKQDKTESPISDAKQLIEVIGACRKYLVLDEQEYDTTFQSYCNRAHFSLLKITSNAYMTLTFSFTNLYLRVLAYGIKEKIERLTQSKNTATATAMDYEIDPAVWALYQELKRFYDDLKRIHKLLRKQKISCALPQVRYEDHYNDIIAYWSQYQNIKFTNPYNGYVFKLCAAESWKPLTLREGYSHSIIDLFALIDSLQHWFVNLPYTNENLLSFADLLTAIVCCYVSTLHEKIRKYLAKELDKNELAFYSKNKKGSVSWNFPRKLMTAINDIVMAKAQLQETISNKLMLDRRYKSEHNCKPSPIISHQYVSHVSQETVTTFYKHKLLPSEFNLFHLEQDNDNNNIWNSLNCISAFQMINKSLSAISFLIGQGLNSDITHEIFLLVWENDKFPPSLPLSKEQVEDELMDMLWKKLCTKCDLLYESISDAFIAYILTDFFSLICLDFIKLLVPKRLKYVLNANQLNRLEYAIDELQQFLLDCYCIEPVLIRENENLTKLKFILQLQLSGTTFIINHHKELCTDADWHDKYQLQNEPFLGPKALFLIIKHRTEHHTHDQLLLEYYEQHSGVKEQFKSFINRWG